MIYLDYSATTPLDPLILKGMQPFFSSIFANPASVHTAGQTALRAVDNARHIIAELLKVSAHDLIFTSGATEANNLALFGLTADQTLKKIHIITTEIEHASILEPLNILKKRGAQITYLKVNHLGLVKPVDVIQALRPETRLVSIAYVNSEIGIIQPIKQIGRLLKKYNQQRYQTWLQTSPRQRGEKPSPVLFHSDATQALNFLDCSPLSLHLDAMSLSAHKIYGPKGVGLLYSRGENNLIPLLYGGHQERNFRSGTVNVPGVVGFSLAVTTAYHQREKNNKKIDILRQKLHKQLIKSLPSMITNTDLSQSVPSHLNLSFPGLEGDLIQTLLSQKGIAVSTGSACAAGDITTSIVLQAMGKSEQEARSALRLTLGKLTTTQDIQTVGKVLPMVITELTERISRLTSH